MFYYELNKLYKTPLQEAQTMQQKLYLEEGSTGK